MLAEKKFKIRPRIIILCVLMLVLFLSIIFCGYSWFLKRQERVLAGFARPSFPYGDYSIAELERLYPQYVNDGVLTVRTPEETHRMFVEKLKEGDLEGAVECCVRQGAWEEIKAGLLKIRESGQLTTMINDLDTEIRNDLNINLETDSSGTFFYSAYRDGDKWGSSIEFIKNNQGIWLIKSF